MNNFEVLCSLFAKSPSLAIKESQKIIAQVTKYDSFEEFYNYQIKNQRISTCQQEWSKQQMAIHCFDCSNVPESCVCLGCFLNGDHQGHDYSVRPDIIGNCDCGDDSMIKKQGFCKHHQGLESSHPENYVDEKLRTTLTDLIFKAAFTSLPKIRKLEDNTAGIILQFISSFINLGDGFRRLISITLTEEVDFEYIIANIFDSSTEFNEFFQQFCGGLINDSIFKVNFSKIAYKVIIEKVIPIKFESMINKTDTSNFEIWDEFWFHTFDLKPVEDNISLFQWDWVTFLIQYSMEMRKYLKYDLNIPDCLLSIDNVFQYATNFQPNEQTQRLFDELFTKVLNCESQGDVFITSTLDSYEDYYFDVPYQYNIYFYNHLHCFTNKKNLKLNKLIEQVAKTIDISKIYCLNKEQINENDHFISCLFDKMNKYCDSSENCDNCWFESFHNGASFFFTFPLYDSLIELFKNDNLTRVKFGNFFTLEKYQCLRIQLGIVTLKKFLSFVCYHQSLAPPNNFGIDHVMRMINSSENISYNISNYIPLFQMLIGLNFKEKNTISEFCLKEFFAFEMSREIGLFDDFNSIKYQEEDVNEKETQMIFSVLYLSLLIVIDRNLFNYNKFKFIEEQLILGLKQGICHLNDLDVFYDHLDPFPYGNDQREFNEILSKVATVKNNLSKKGAKNNNDSSFYLKDGIEWRTITALNLFNDQKVLLNNEISKHPKSVLKIPEFEPEETSFFQQDDAQKIDTNGLIMNLKDYLLTPTVLALVYYSLRKNEGQKVVLNDHLSMNILILASKFVKNVDTKSSSLSFNESTVIEYDSSLIDLISKFKRIIFDFKLDKDEKATIQNNLNCKAFNILLHIKICSPKLGSKSFIDILLEKGEIGKSCLKQMSVDLGQFQNGEDQRIEINQIKKNHAKKMKEEIMKHYKNAINNFTVNKSEAIEGGTSSLKNFEEVCSICSTKKEEILSYPLYIYKTKFPFIIDKPPLIEVDSDDECIVDDDKKNHNRNTDSNEEEEEYSPNHQENSSSSNNNNDDDDDDESENKLDEGKIKCMKHCSIGNNFVIQFGICQHPIHPNCVNNDKFSECPIDRSNKNGFLPMIDNLPKEVIFNSNDSSLSDEIQESINVFIENFSSFNSKPSNNIIIELFKSISGTISTYEIRLRNLPDCLDNKKSKLLTRNLFLTAWHFYRMEGKPNLDSFDNRLTLFQLFIKELIKCDEIESIECNKSEIVKRIIHSSLLNSIEIDSIRKEKEIFLFFKRVCLSEIFLLNNNVTDVGNFVDWDEILSIEYLLNRYDFKFSFLKNFEFNQFYFTKLPKEFLHFALKPYKFPIVLTYKMFLFNILDYNYLINKFDDFEDHYDENEEFENNQKNLKKFKYTTFKRQLINDCLKNVYPSVFLFVGSRASKVIVVDNGKIAYLRPFYIDKYGCTDVGFERNQPLYLNEYRYQRIIDEVLSGDYSNYLEL
ncbi:hypothetical protein M9Y10_010522 [Tritrichomonas musculus]|uniref:E3 ubiquitin-protein ligase n=1 Tax=Tritrichomonas musculus TaxID=1915356 RepID=A0ABR2INF7_9EUKA